MHGVWVCVCGRGPSASCCGAKRELEGIPAKSVRFGSGIWGMVHQKMVHKVVSSCLWKLLSDEIYESIGEYTASLWCNLLALRRYQNLVIR